MMEVLKYTGNILVNTCSSPKVTVNSCVIWRGAYNGVNKTKSISVTIDGGIWDLAGDSYVNSVTLINYIIVRKMVAI